MLLCGALRHVPPCVLTVLTLIATAWGPGLGAPKLISWSRSLDSAEQAGLRGCSHKHGRANHSVAVQVLN